MKIIKKVILLILSLCCVVLLAACSNDNSSSMPPSSAKNGASMETESNTSNEPQSPLKSTKTGENPSDSGTDAGKIRIRLTFSGGETVAVLEDNPTTQSLLAQLPITVTFDDFAGAEKIAYLPEDLSTQDAPKGDDPQIGDVACYGPWGNLVFYYKDQPYANGIIPMGRIESGLEKLSAMDAGFEVTIERMK